ncbi:DUF4434 domain-containing protein [Longispora sp. K20-0274]|uniref:DUF4434 domain-containing protein n=1 Tax=Longispora sp. K20-0274 TaxID=3088255 RepID=UPI0039995E10
MRPSLRRGPWARRAGVLAGLSALLASTVQIGPAQAEPTSPTPPTNTIEQALKQARGTGAPVQVKAATTATDTLTAGPNGQLTLARSAVPVRKRAGADWVGLDATLEHKPDGTIAPKVTTSGLSLSGGGTGPLATLSNAGTSLALGMPMALPAPKLEGASATYPNVLADVDLKVTVDAQGGFREVLVVKTAQAAADPALAKLRLATRTDGVKVETDASGNLSAKDRTGRATFTAPAPLMWDSTTGSSPKATAGLRSADSSSPSGPGRVAKVARIEAKVDATGIDLTPDPTLLRAATYPLYLDPGWTPTAGQKTGWASIAGNYPGARYWNTTPAPDGRMQVGYSSEDGMITRTLINFAIPVSQLSGATIQSAQLTMTETHSWSCTAQPVNLYAPSQTLDYNNAIWNSWKNTPLGGLVASANVAHGHDSGCPVDGVGFDVLSAVNADVAANKTTQTFALTADETNTDAWKKFDQNSPVLTIVYNHAPNTPTALGTSPTSSCAANPPSYVGDGDVTLASTVTDADSDGLAVTYQLWKTDDATHTAPAGFNPNPVSAASGDIARKVVDHTVLSGAAGNAVTSFSWRVAASDGSLTGPWSATCAFRFDPNRPGAPTIDPPASATIGQPVSIQIKPPASGPLPATYLYQLNGAQAEEIAADAAGKATVTVTPPRHTNTLTVTAKSPGGNIGLDSARLVFNAMPAAVIAADGDLNGDGIPDLATIGAKYGFPSGLWQATGNVDNDVSPYATDIGENGNGISDHSPADFDGGQVITGRFMARDAQDLLVYYPPDSAKLPGSAVVLPGSGDGSPIQFTESPKTISVDILLDPAGASPRSLTSVYLGTRTPAPTYPDLVGITGDGSGLMYLPSLAGIGDYDMAAPLNNLTPTGGTDWGNWQIASGQAWNTTLVYLWNSTTGDLYVWINPTYDQANGKLNVAQKKVAGGWNTGGDLRLRAGDINRDGTVDLWSVGADRTVTAHLVTDIWGTPAITSRTPQQLQVANHAFKLDEGVTPIVDSVGSLNITTTAGVAWKTSGLFAPALSTNGTSTVLSTNSSAVATDKDFNVSAWVYPTALGGVVASQDGTRTSGFKLWSEASDGSWRFAMPRTDADSPVLDVVAAPSGSVKLGAWVRLTASYRKSTGGMVLYVNGAKTASNAHIGSWQANGKFQIGAGLSAGTRTGFFTGQISRVETGPGFQPRSPQTPEADPLAANRVNGTFIQPDLIDSWSDATLDHHFAELRDLKIGTAVLQWTANGHSNSTGGKTTVYPTDLAGTQKVTNTDVVQRTLSAADRTGRKVWMGLQVNDAWWNTYANDPTWTNTEAELSKALARDLWARYGYHPSFAGWYLPLETDNVHFGTPAAQANLVAFYRSVVTELRRLGNLPVAAAPFFNAVNPALPGWQNSAAWGQMWTDILRQADFDVIALQDGVGAGHADAAALAEWYTGMKTAIANAGTSTQLFADTETFEIGPNGLRSMPIRNLVTDLRAVRPYVTGYWSFSFSHYLSADGPTGTLPYNNAYRQWATTATGDGTDGTAPTQPGTLTATTNDAQTVTLTWGSSTDVGSGVAGYHVYRDTELVYDTVGSAGQFVDRQLDGGRTYSYQVRAFDGSGLESPLSNTAPASTPALPAAPVNYARCGAADGAPGCTYTSSTPASPTYPDTGGRSLTDGVHGTNVYGPQWQGRNALGTYSFTIDLGSARSIKEIDSNLLQIRSDYLFMPPKVRYYVSTDGVNFQQTTTIDAPAIGLKTQSKTYRQINVNATGRYVKIEIDGGTAWTMLDELEVRGS